MKYIVYSKSTGDIVSFCACSGDKSPPTQPNGYAWMEADIPSNTTIFYVRDGELALRPARPANYYYWDGSSWVADINLAAAEAKMQRDLLLYQSDWTELVGAENRLGQSLYVEWQNYRQDLRDISNQVGFPLNIIWPTPPA